MQGQTGYVAQNDTDSSSTPKASGVGKFFLNLFIISVVVVIGIIIYHFGVIDPIFKEIKKSICNINQYGEGCPLYNYSSSMPIYNTTTPYGRPTLPSYQQTTTPMVRK